MTDQERFERRLEVRLLAHVEVAGRDFDAAALTRAAASAQRGRRWWPHWSPARPTALPIGGSRRPILMAALLTVLLAALAIGGALVGSEFQRSARDPLAGLVTERIEPGVLRVVRDDSGHDLASIGVVEIAVGLDGAVWMNGRSGLFRLREPGIADGEPDRDRTGLTVGPDGSVWSRGDWRRRDRSIQFFDGERWIYYPGPPVGAHAPIHAQTPPFAIDPDASVWGAWTNGLRPQGPGFELARLEGGRWVVVDLTGWPDGLIGSASAAYGAGLAATTDGSLWLFADDGDDGPRGNTLARFDSRGWDFITIPSRVSYNVLQLAAGPDGSLWVFGTDGVFGVDGESTVSMARYADGAWTLVEAPPGIRPSVYLGTDVALRPVVTSDGAVWMGRIGNTKRLSQTFCDGLLRYDGTWTGYLADHCVHSVAAGPRGEAWVVTGPIDDQSGEPTATEVYLIDPSTSAPGG